MMAGATAEELNPDIKPTLAPIQDSTERPYLLVDVDGVLNVFGYKYRDEDFDNDVIDSSLEEVFEASDAGGPFYIIRVPAGTRFRMKKLEELYECVWCTTWGASATTQLSPKLGFGADWPIIDFTADPGGRMHQTWKLPTVAKWAMTHDRSFAWIDDDLHEDCEFWAERLYQREGRKVLLVNVKPEIGLTDEHVLKLERFATNG